MAYRNNVFVSFDGDSDMHYYRLMRAWKQNDNTPFEFNDAHDLCQARDTSTEESIKRSLQVRLANSKVFVSLIGERTRYLYKFVRWEIEEAIRRGIPVIGVNLNGLRWMDEGRVPPLLRDQLAIYVSFNARILQHALDNWPDDYQRLARQAVSGPYYYVESVYRALGL